MTSQEINYGLTNCTWSSCREGCTAEFFKCHHIRVSYTPQIPFTEGALVEEFEEEDWAYLDRTEREPDTEIEYVVTDTPLLVNIKGIFDLKAICPTGVNCLLPSNSLRSTHIF